MRVWGVKFTAALFLQKIRFWDGIEKRKDFLQYAPRTFWCGDSRDRLGELQSCPFVFCDWLAVWAWPSNWVGNKFRPLRPIWTIFDPYSTKNKKSNQIKWVV